jgi:hypothetical protein
MFHDIGKITIPHDGVVTIFQYRFPCAGEVRNASLRLLDAPVGAGIEVHGVVDGEIMFNIPWGDRALLLRFPESIRVDEFTYLSVQLARPNAAGSIDVHADITYLFQESPRAAVQRPVR